jgi:hypothetical protein
MRASAAPSMSAPSPARREMAKKSSPNLLSRMADALGFGSAGVADADDESPLDDSADLELAEASLAPPPPPAPPASHAPAAPKAMKLASKEEASRPEPVVADPSGELARSQAADGSFGGDVARTAAALLALVLLGHTRRTGSRRRTVLKAAQWLAQHTSDPLAALALRLLDAAEAGEPVKAGAEWAPLFAAGSEGAALSRCAQA